MKERNEKKKIRKKEWKEERTGKGAQEGMKNEEEKELENISVKRRRMAKKKKKEVIIKEKNK